MPSKHKAGKCGAASCCEPPCCVDVWDYVRAAYTAADATFYGLDVLTFPLTGTVVRHSDIAEIVDGDYQCTVVFSPVEDSTNGAFYSGVPKRIPIYSYVLGGVTYYRYSDCIVQVGFSACFPTPGIAMGVSVRYRMDYTATSDPRSSFVSAGYVYSNNGSYESWDRSTHANNMNFDIIRNFSIGGKVFEFWAGLSMGKTNTADFMSGFPSSVIAEPVFNPGGLKIEFDLT